MDFTPLPSGSFSLSPDQPNRKHWPVLLAALPIFAVQSLFNLLKYAEHQAEMDIRTLEVIVGHLPKRALNLTVEWAIDHRAELMEDWNLCQAKQQPKKIQPLAQAEFLDKTNGVFQVETRVTSNRHIAIG